MTFNFKKIIFLLFCVVVNAICVYNKAMSQPMENVQATEKNENKKNKPIPNVPHKPKFPDKYSQFDNKNKANKAVKIITEELIESAIESSRQMYIKGLICVQRGDTVEAIRNMEEALENLNKLVSYSEIEANTDFTELTQNIISDYERFANKTEMVSDNNLNLFISKNRLFDTTQILSYSNEKSASVVSKRDNDTSNFIFRIPSSDMLTIPIVAHESVDQHVAFLTKGPGRQHLLSWLKRSGKWYNMVSDIVASEGMPAEIICLSMIESAFNPKAVSSAGAVGLWQFMYSTGIDYGLNKRESIWLDERRDPVKATRASMRYLKDLYSEFNDWHLTLCSYNWGQGNVRRARRQVNIEQPNYWDIRDKQNVNMPKEARFYVPLFVALIKVLSNPAEYGIDVTSINYDKEFRYDMVDLQQATNLQAVSKAIGVGVSELRDLNPELVYDITPPDRKYYRLRVPEGTGKIFASNFEKLSIEERKPYLTHKVKKGEDILSVSSKYDVAIDELLSLNNLKQKSILLSSGAELRIPIGGKTYAQSTLVYSKDGLAPKTEVVNINSNYHTVKVGESVYSVAAQYNISAVDLRNWNNLSIEDDLLEAGQTLVINDKGLAKSNNIIESKNSNDNEIRRTEIQTNTKTNENTDINKTKISSNSGDKDITKEKSNKKEKEKKVTTYIVKKNDNLSSIADKYDISINELKKINKLKSDVLKVGMTLKVSNDAKIKESNINKKEKKSDDKVKEDGTIYIVKKGDTMSSIAKLFNVTIKKIMDLNDNINTDNIQIGQKIKIR